MRRLTEVSSARRPTIARPSARRQLLKKNASVAASRALPHISSPPAIMSDIMCSKARRGLSGFTGRRLPRTVSAQSATGRMSGFSSANIANRRRFGWLCPHQLGALFRHHRAHCRPHQSAVDALSDLRNPRDVAKADVVFGAVAADLTNVVELAGLETEQVVSLAPARDFRPFRRHP